VDGTLIQRGSGFGASATAEGFSSLGFLFLLHAPDALVVQLGVLGFDFGFAAAGVAAASCAVFIGLISIACL
jgi:hypothetical protein